MKKNIDWIYLIQITNHTSVLRIPIAQMQLLFHFNPLKEKDRTTIPYHSQADEVGILKYIYLLIYLLLTTRHHNST